MGHKIRIGKYSIGQKAILKGKEVTVEGCGININKKPIYKVGGLWYFEDELEEWYPPCPL